MLRTAVNSLLAVLYPQKCYVCGGIADDAHRLPACDACWQRTRLLARRQPDCVKCGEFRDRSDSFRNIDTATCGHCTEHFYDIARSAGVYEYALAASVIRLKTVPKLSQQVHTLLMDAAGTLLDSGFDVVIPVPLSPQRLRERGFNQAAILASAVASHWRIEIDAVSLRRDQHTPMHRVGMDRKARELSVHKAFSVARPRLIEGRRILLVDDVFTSGATTSNCAAALKKNGAERVAVLTLARAVL
jgi:ComF family protein